MTGPTIYSIAELLGISASSVSRAFTRPDLVKDEVRATILETAERVGYRPNLSARSLVTGRKEALGLLVSDITNPFFPPLVRAIQIAATRHGSSVLLADAGQASDSEVDLISRLAPQVDGIIVASPKSSSVSIKKALDGVPAVIVNRPISGMTSVSCDNTPALREAGEHLAELGHRRIALILGPEASWAARQRAKAVRQWAPEAGVELVELGSFAASYDGGRAGGAAFAESGATAVFAFDDLVACGVVAELTERGIDVPRERSVVGCDGVLISTLLTPALTTMEAPMDDLGESAVRLLFEAAMRGQMVQERVLGTFVPRRSSGAVHSR